MDKFLDELSVIVLLLADLPNDKMTVIEIRRYNWEVNHCNCLDALQCKQTIFLNLIL